MLSASLNETFPFPPSRYNPLQIYTVLRTFGHLNYLPKNNTTFLVKVEEVLDQEFEHLDISHCVEILCSFAFLGKIPTNFVNKVLTPSFLTRLKGELLNNVTWSIIWIKKYHREEDAVLVEHSFIVKMGHWIDPSWWND